MSSDAAERLADAARRRSESAQRRARDAIRALDRAGRPVSFAAVAETASVSRAWLYRVPELRAEIERLRTGHRRPVTRLPSGQRASADSLRRRIEVLLDANRLLREENRRLNDRLASVLGEGRAPTRS